TVATWSGDVLVLWDPLTGRERHKLANGRKLLAFSPDGNLLLEANGTIEQWEPATGKSRHIFRVVEGDSLTDYNGIAAVYNGIAAVCSRDGKAMATGSNDRTVRLWSLETGQELWKAQRPIARERRIPDVGRHRPLGFTRDGKAVVSIGHDFAVRFLDA